VSGFRIRFFRKARGVRVKDLAKALGVEAQTLSNWESGRRPNIAFATHCKVCEELQISRRVYFSKRYDDLTFNTEPGPEAEAEAAEAEAAAVD
jgi:transcriptional regulator with XRE-family HTH domain